ncbi:DsbA family protein [Marinobacter sp. SS21]|uniref:DsbA family protein n=1 Tax=Marinobacter sp. SS21 TaxID=2979460 RepID=UPI00232BB809|nr:thioredoxin domain-containing protein [Marinobacter sp. SS21]MDC0663604.1 thioredoxin domain-containing protein [Marinobacter sp. SS21]
MGEANRRKTTGQPGYDRAGRRRLGWLAIAVAVVIAIVAGLVLMTQPPEKTSEALPVAATEAEPFPVHLDRFGVSVGAEDAPVVVREFADYQCPACGRFADASRRLKEEYVAAGKVRFVFFDLPLRQHQNAMPAAMAARCAGDQDGYWAMHDALFAKQGEWSGTSKPVDMFSRYASEQGLDERRFRRCMTTELHREDIEASVQVAQQMRVLSTPTVLVDNIQLTRPGWGQLSAVVERELAAAE